MRRFKVAQVEAPPAPAPAPPMDMGGMMPPPPPGMPPPPPGMPPAPDASGGSPAGARPQEISGPLDSLSKIIYDAGAEDKVDNEPFASEGQGGDFVDELVESISDEIWQQYGGTIDKKHLRHVATPGQTGQRTDDISEDPEQQFKDREATENQRYLRLPAGKSITDITTFEELSQVVRGLIQGKLKPAPPAGAPPAGMPPPMASSLKQMLRVALILDSHGKYAESDLIDRAVMRSLLDFA